MTDSSDLQQDGKSLSRGMDYVNCIGLDWVRFSFAGASWPFACALFDASTDFQSWMSSQRFFKNYISMPMEGVTIAAEGMPEGFSLNGRFIVDFSGNGLGVFFAKNPWLKLHDFMANCLAQPNSRVTRLDVAFDDYQSLLDIERIKSLCKEKEENSRVITRWQLARHLDAFGIGGKDKGNTLYLGSRDSDSFGRVYDKRALELGRGASATALPANWIRFELEMKGDRADWVAREAVRHGLHPFYFTGLLKSLIDFRRNKRQPGQRKDDLPVARWWSKFLNDPLKRPLRVPKPVATIERKKKWVMQSVAPTLALLQHHFDGDMTFIFEALQSGNRRLTPKHLALLETVTHGV